MTTSLTLISHHLCPFVQRAKIVLLEKAVPFDSINMDLADKPDWFLAISPTGKVPLLKVARRGMQDATIFESAVICEYLEESQPGHRLHPADAVQRAMHRSWMEFGSGVLGDAWGYLTAKDAENAAAKKATLLQKLAQVESALVTSEGPYFSGKDFSMVDAVFAPVFRYFDVLPGIVSGFGNDTFAGLPKVDQWRKELAARSSVRAAVGEDYAQRFEAFLRSHGSHVIASA